MLKQVVKAGRLALLTTRYFCKSHAVGLWMIAGGATLVAGTVAAVKASPSYSKVKEVNDEKIHEIEEKAVSEEREVTEEERTEIKEIKKETCKEAIKAFWPMASLTTAGILCLIMSNRASRRALAAASAATAAITAKFNQYRQRVIQEQGEAVDQYYMGERIMKNNHAKTIIDTETNEEKEVEECDLVMLPKYSKMFDASASGSKVVWSPERNYNIQQLRNLEHTYNQKLRLNGVVLLNEIITDIWGAKARTAEGAKVGWYFDLKDENRHNEIDFGLGDILLAGDSRYGRGGSDPNIQLSFNVDGEVAQLL